ncbi:MAG TPA: phosphotransferase, partial [Planctomycetota bacterium]
MSAPLHDPDWPANFGDPAATEIGRGVGGRRYLRLERPGPWGESLFVKDFGPGGTAAAAREFEAARSLRAAGAATPRPWAVASVAGSAWLVLEDLGPRSALDAEQIRARPEALAEVARAAARLHGADAIHGDVHLGNLLRHPRTGDLMWIDLRRLRFGADATSRERDLGRLFA